MAANIVENVRLLQIVELVAATDEAGRGKSPPGEIGEEHRIGDEARHRHDPPPGGACEHIAQPAEIRDAAGGDAKRAEPLEIFLAGPPDQQLLLALEQQPPDRVLFLAVTAPVLRDRKIRGRVRRAPAHRPLHASRRCDQPFYEPALL